MTVPPKSKQTKGLPVKPPRNNDTAEESAAPDRIRPRLHPIPRNPSKTNYMDATDPATEHGSAVESKANKKGNL